MLLQRLGVISISAILIYALYRKYILHDILVAKVSSALQMDSMYIWFLHFVIYFQLIRCDEVQAHSDNLV
jgi:hypothetical protein